jgi:hypothetical protein
METEKESSKEIKTKKVCSECLLGNLTENVGIIKCSKCNTIFCYHFASAIDPQYCTECFGDLTVTKEIVTKEYVHYNEETDEITSYKRRARATKISGEDWLFAQRRIENISDAELEAAIEYHRAILGLMIYEREVRRAAKMHRYAGIKIQIKPASDSTTTTTKVTKEIKSSKTVATAQATVASMLKGGMSQAELMNMLKTLQAKLATKP